MENSQRVQQENSEGDTPAPESKPEYKPEKTVKSKHSSALRLFLRLIAYHPWLLVVALLGLFAGSAVLAVYSLGYAGRIEEPHSNKTEEPEVDIVQPIPSPSDENNNPFPLWVVFAIALSCGGGCLVISRWINGSTLSKKSQKRVNRYEVRQAQRRNYQTEPLAPKKPPVFVAPKTNTQTETTRKANTTVTILPPQSNSLGIRQEPLVQRAEAQKKGPISFVVRK